MRAAMLTLVLTAGPAAAHPGHLAEVAGHGHWVAGAAIGLAVLLGLWGKLKGRGDAEPDAEAEDEPETGETATGEEARA